MTPKTITNHGCPPQPQGRGPNGRRFCRWCHVEVPKGRSSWCNDECRQHGDFNLSKLIALRRDKRACVICSVAATPRWGAPPIERRVRVEVDHIVAVVDGGSHHPDNLRTLCAKCHAAVTKQQAAARAEKRRQNKALLLTACREADKEKAVRR